MEAMTRAFMEDEVAVSVVTLAELGAGGRTAEAIEEDLRGFVLVELKAEGALVAGRVFSRTPRTQSVPLPDYFIRAQAATRGWKHLTNDRRRLSWWPEVEFLLGN